MITPTRVRIALPLLATLIAACSGQGPDVIDPSSTTRSQSAILVIDDGSASELGIVKEPDVLQSAHAYLDANGSPLGRRIDGIFQSSNRLFLLHRQSATLTVIDQATRMRLAEITGFSDTASALCGVAFSNLSQGWVIDHNQPFVFHVDAVNAKLVDTLPIEGRPTSVAAMGDKVFVASMRGDGTGLVSVFRSNFTAFVIETRLTFPSPVVFMAPNGTKDAMVLVSAGAAGAGPMVHVVRAATMEQSAERELNAAPLTQFIGQVPEFAAVTNENYLYLATDVEVIRIDIKSSRLTSQNWLEGSYTTLAADYWTDLLYVFDPSSSALKRVDNAGNVIPPISVPSTVTAIEFVNSSRVN